MSLYSEMMGSFVRTGNYPIEADYIFQSVDELKAWASDEINVATLHEGLLKIVKDETGQLLWWVVSDGDNLRLKHLISEQDSADFNDALAKLLADLEEEIRIRIDEDNKIWGNENSAEVVEAELADTELKDHVGEPFTHLRIEEIDILADKNNGMTSPSYYSADGLRLYAKNSISFSSPSTLKRIQLTIPAEGNGLKKQARLIPSTGIVYQSIGGTTAKWVGESDNVTFVVSDKSEFGTGGTSSAGQFIFSAVRLESGTDDTIPEYLNSILKISNAVRDLQEKEAFSSNALKAIAGTDEDDVISYLSQLEYRNLTEVSEALKALKDSVPAIVQDAYYDNTTEEIVIIFKSYDNNTLTVRINASSLIREWEPDNVHPSKVVEITREEVAGSGADKVSADVRIYNSKDNILQKLNNSLYVKGTSDNITHKGLSLQEYLNKAEKDQLLYWTDEEVKAAFTRDVYANYDLKYHTGHVFFATDKNLILVDGVEYGLTPELRNQIGEAVVNITLGKDAFICTKNDGTTFQVPMAPTANKLEQKTLALNYTPLNADVYALQKDSEVLDTVLLTFTPLSPLTLTVPEGIGDIEKGTKAADLKGKPLSEILDSILFKTIYPTVTDPAITIGASPASATVEAGSTLLTALTNSFNKGSVVVEDGVTARKDYVGNATSTVYQVKVAGGAANSNAGVGSYPSAGDAAIDTVTRYEPGTYSYKVTVNYAAGPTMTTSKGASPNPMPTTNKGNVTNPHPAGSITSSYGVTRNVTLPVFIDPASKSYAKQPLKNWGVMTFTGVAMNATDKSNPIKIKTPRKLEYVKSYNAVSGKYDVPQTSNFAVNTINETINSKSYTYYEYIWNGGALSKVNMEIKTY